jgi:hypothetical protein
MILSEAPYAVDDGARKPTTMLSRPRALPRELLDAR